MTPESAYLIDLAKRNLQPYLQLPQLRAAMVTGSAALGLSDRYSDIDMTLYYDELPTEEELTAARLHNGGSDRLWLMGERNTGDIAESYRVQGVECQFGHITLAAWERDMATVLEHYDVNTPLHKALSGTLECMPLYGIELLETLMIVPADFALRLDRLFTAPAAEAALDLKALVGETLDLVAHTMPQVDVGSVQERLERRRPPWQLPDAAV